MLVKNTIVYKMFSFCKKKQTKKTRLFLFYFVMSSKFNKFTNYFIARNHNVFSNIYSVHLQFLIINFYKLLVKESIAAA